MKKKLLAAGTALLAVVAGMVSASSNKSVPTFTAIWPMAVYQGFSQPVTVTGTNIAKNTSLIVNGASYPLKIINSTSASFTFTPAMTQTVGFIPVQLKTANLSSQTQYFQVCEPLVITTTSLTFTVGVPIGPEGKIQTSGGCILPNQ